MLFWDIWKSYNVIAIDEKVMGIVSTTCGKGLLFFEPTLKEVLLLSNQVVEIKK